MVSLYVGTPGSGKSLHMAADILFWLNKKHRNVIGNFYVNEKLLKLKGNTFTCIENSKLTVKALFQYAQEHGQLGKEKSCLLCIDECQCIFNPREFNRTDRLDWINFFSQHRKLGFEVILVTQNNRLLDRQIRSMVEYEVKHRKVNNFKIGFLLPVPTFCAVYYWAGVNERLNCEFFMYRKKLGQLYDSYKLFDGSVPVTNGD